jgi:hypothetical protein
MHGERELGTSTMRFFYTIAKMVNIDLIDNVELRRVQALHGERTLTFVLPKSFAVHLGIEKGDFLKCHVDGNRLIVEKVKT